MLKRLKNYLRVRWLRWRYPYRPIPDWIVRDMVVWREREDGLYRLSTHTASPDDEADFTKFPSSGGGYVSKFINRKL